MKGTVCRLGPPVVQSDTDIQTAQQCSWHRQLYCSNVNVEWILMFWTLQARLLVMLLCFTFVCLCPCKQHMWYFFTIFNLLSTVDEITRWILEYFFKNLLDNSSNSCSENGPISLLVELTWVTISHLINSGPTHLLNTLYLSKIHAFTGGSLWLNFEK